MKNKLSILNIVFFGELVTFFAIIFGIVPREFTLYLSGIIILYIIFASLEDSTVFFVRSIPFFLALPITATFDSFNLWRILSVIIFLKWFFSYVFRPGLLKLKLRSFLKPKLDNLSFIAILLLILSVISLLVAPNLMLSVKRILYFINLSLIAIVIHDIASSSINYRKRIIKNIAIPTIIVALFGIGQLISTYFVDIYSFMRIWGEGIQCRQFGNLWCDTAVQLGNTWLAYYGPQLSLRVFSLFPDTHSFPIFLLLGLPSIFALALHKIDFSNFKQAIRIRGKMWVVFIPIIFFIMILTGTRGIWLASLAGIIAGIIILKIDRHTDTQTWKKNITKYIMMFFIIFFLLFAVTQPIFSSRQFRVPKEDSELLRKRLRSILDFGETSNAARLAIWEATAKSIIRHPILGVGIAGFPVVLDQDLRLSKAGSSAHNIYLHITAELGIIGLIITLWLMWLILKRTYTGYKNDLDNFMSVYYPAIFIFLIWVFAYSLTDFALFDERAFLLFVISIALVSSNVSNKSILERKYDITNK